MTMRVQLCRSWNVIGGVEAYRFMGIVRDLAAGNWQLEAFEDAVSWGWNQQLSRQWMPEEVDGVRVMEASRVRFAGPVRATSGGDGGRELTVTSNGNRWRWSGPDLWAFPQARLVFPDPTAPPSWGVSHDELTDTAAAIVREFIERNLGVDALTDRQIAIAVTDDDSGTNAQRSGRLQPLSDLVIRLCQDAELSCRIDIDTAGALTMRIERPRDLSNTIVYSGPTDIVEAKVRHVPAEVTWTLAGGQGDGAARVFRIANTGAQGLDRIERFLDLSSATSAAELQEAATATNRLGVEQWQVSATPTDDAAQRWKAGVDFRVGDKVAANIRGNRYTLPVSAIQFDLSAERQVVRPILGTAAPDELRGLQRDVLGLAERFDRNIA